MANKFLRSELCRRYRKKEIISAVFTDNLHIENGVLRTTRVNEAIKYIYLIDNKLVENKKGQTKNKFDLSCQVDLPVQFSNLFMHDLRLLAALSI